MNKKKYSSAWGKWIYKKQNELLEESFDMC